MWEGSKRRKSISLCNTAKEMICFIWVLCCFICLLYVLRGGKQDTTMFLKNLWFISGFCLKFGRGFETQLGFLGACFWSFQHEILCSWRERELRDFWNSAPPRSPFQESEILHCDFRNGAINNNLTKSVSNGFVLCWSVAEYSHKPR